MTEVQVVTASPIEVYRPSYFAQLAENALVVDSGELIKNDSLGTLEKVPFIVTSVAYRKGDITPKGATEPNAYVSVTAVVADEATLVKLHKFGRIDMDAIPFMPEESIIFNDGSTGVKRQITEMLHVRGYIRVVENDSELKVGGGTGESSFDLKPHQWFDAPRGTFQLDDDGYGIYETSLDQPLYCRRGLRASDYQNQYTNEGKTWYLA